MNWIVVWHYLSVNYIFLCLDSKEIQLFSVTTLGNFRIIQIISYFDLIEFIENQFWRGVRGKVALYPLRQPLVFPVHFLVEASTQCLIRRCFSLIPRDWNSRSRHYPPQPPRRQSFCFPYFSFSLVLFFRFLVASLLNQLEGSVR